MKKRRFRTVRCIIRREDRFLLVIHRGARTMSRRAWGLPGGRIERHEDFEETARREIREELSITLGELREVGDYRYKGALHRVMATDFDGNVIEFQRKELFKIGWKTLDEIAALAAADRLHTGFEHEAIADFLALLSGVD